MICFTFHKNERLKSEKLIARLFKEGRSYMAYPLRVVWMPLPQAPSPMLPEAVPSSVFPMLEVQFPISNFQSPIQVAFSVPKRVFKKAVERNRIKRLMREAWRLQKHIFYEKIQAQGLRLAVMLVYVGKEELPFSEVAAGVKKAIRKFEA